MHRRLFRSNAGELRLGNSLGRGGEGEVFAITDDESTVAKLYHNPPSKEKAAKLSVMTRYRADLSNIAAWPIELVKDSSGVVVGLTMPRLLRHEPIYHLYNPKQRRHEFPNATWPFLLHAARNVAAAFEQIHSVGHVVGDVNQGNLTVSDNATVKFIDCDSFQITGDGTTYLCEVGVAHFTPPELQGRSFAGVIRSPQHDAFGMSVLIFHLLFVGRHPFAGRFSGTGEMPIERAIKEGRFAFARDAIRYQMTPPPHSLPLRGVGDEALALFEAAFLSQSNRPTAEQWRKALGDMQARIVRCSKFEAHQFLKDVGTCPWCEIERLSGTDLFVSVHAGRFAVGGQFNLDVTWNAIVAVSPPLDALPASATVLGRPFARAAVYNAVNAITGFVAVAGIVSCMAAPDNFGWVGILGIVLYLVVSANNPLEKEKKRRLEIVQSTERTLTSSRGQWSQAVEMPIAKFRGRLKELEKAKTELLSLPGAYDKAIKDLQRKHYDLQLEIFLERFYLANASIKGFGPGRKAILISYGVETAGDINSRALSNVPGIGPEFSRRLQQWRSACERKFVYNANAPIDPQNISRVNEQFARRKRELEMSLTRGVGELREFARQADLGRRSLESELRKHVTAVAQAKADAAAVQ